jgi:hypothetical protein
MLSTLCYANETTKSNIINSSINTSKDIFSFMNNVSNHNYKENNSMGLKDFVNLDLKLIGGFPTQEDWQKLSDKYKSIPQEKIRYIDSLDYYYKNDTLNVKVYTQNYLYQSKNTYYIVKNKKRTTDTLTICNFHINLKMKKKIADALNYRSTKFYSQYHIEKEIKKGINRIKFHKNFKEKSKNKTAILSK